MYLLVFGQYTTVDSDFSCIAPCNCTAVDSRSTRAHRDTFLWQKKKTMFNAHLSAAILVVVNWPNHGPGVDASAAASPGIPTGIWRGRSYPRNCEHIILYSFKHYKIKIIYSYIMFYIVLTF